MKKFASIILCLAMLLSLCACGNSGGKKKGEYTLSEYLNTGTTIWFNIRNLYGKDSSVSAIVVLEKDGTAYYQGNTDYTLGELEQMEDADIIAMVKEGHKEYIANHDYYISPNKEDVLRSIKSAMFRTLYDITEHYTMLEKETFLDIRCQGLSNLAPCAREAAEQEWENIEKVFKSAIALRVLEETFTVDNRPVRFYQNVINTLYVDSSVDDRVMYMAEIFDYLESELDEDQLALAREKINETEEALACMDTVAENIYNGILRHIEEVKENAKPGRYELSLKSDSTGNNTKSEKLFFRFPTPEGTAWNGFTLSGRMQPAGDSYVMEVYDSLYAGYQVYSAYFITRVEKGVELTLDAVGKCNLPVDVEPEYEHSHSYNEQMTAATCTSNGYSTFVCDCGDSYKAHETIAFGHTWGEWEKTKEPTYETEGEETRVCSNCNMEEIRLTEKLPPYVPPQERLQNANVGEYVVYGRYEQDNDSSNGAEDLEWLVLAKEDDRILLVSRYCLEMQPYHTTNTEITWEDCYLREWMNSTFLGAAFNDEEMQYILLSEIENSGSKDGDSYGGNDTSDMIFALSEVEVEKFFVDAGVSAYAERTLYTRDGNAGLKADCHWWLRTPGLYNTYAMTVSGSGNLGTLGQNVGADTIAVRPAMWVSLK